MRWQDMTVVGTAAAATALTVILFMGGLTVAEDQAEPQPIPWPTLQGEGYTLTFKHDKAEYQPGEKPVLMLECTNTTPSPLDVTMTLRMSSMSPSNMMSRMGPVPVMEWQEKVTWTVDPGTHSRQIAVGKEPAQGKAITFTLEAGGNAIATRPIGAKAMPNIRLTPGHQRVNNTVQWSENKNTNISTDPNDNIFTVSANAEPATRAK